MEHHSTLIFELCSGGPRTDVLTGPLPVDSVYFPGLLKPSTTTYMIPNSTCSFSIWKSEAGEGVGRALLPLKSQVEQVLHLTRFWGPRHSLTCGNTAPFPASISFSPLCLHLHILSLQGCHSCWVRAMLL